MARQAEPARRRARGGVAADAPGDAPGEARRRASRLRLAEGLYVTDGTRLYEVQSVVVRCTPQGVELERHVIVTNARASCADLPDLIRLTEVELANGWRNVELIPFELESASHLWEGARG